MQNWSRSCGHNSGPRWISNFGFIFTNKSTLKCQVSSPCLECEGGWKIYEAECSPHNLGPDNPGSGCTLWNVWAGSHKSGLFCYTDDFNLAYQGSPIGMLSCILKCLRQKRQICLFISLDNWQALILQIFLLQKAEHLAFFPNWWTCFHSSTFITFDILSPAISVSSSAQFAAACLFAWVRWAALKTWKKYVYVFFLYFLFILILTQLMWKLKW